MKTIWSRNIWPNNLYERTVEYYDEPYCVLSSVWLLQQHGQAKWMNGSFHKQDSELLDYLKSTEFLERQEVPCTMQVVNWGTAYATGKCRMRKQGIAHACGTDPNWPHVCFIYTRVQRPLLSSPLTDSTRTSSCRQLLLSTCNRNGR